MATNIKVKVNKSWNGMVAIRDKYVDEAIRLKVGLEVTYGTTGKMSIPADKVSTYHTRTGKVYKDKFSNASHGLVYYKVPKTGTEYIG